MRLHMSCEMRKSVFGVPDQELQSDRAFVVCCLDKISLVFVFDTSSLATASECADLVMTWSRLFKINDDIKVNISFKF